MISFREVFCWNGLEYAGIITGACTRACIPFGEYYNITLKLKLKLLFSLIFWIHKNAQNCSQHFYVPGSCAGIHDSDHGCGCQVIAGFEKCWTSVWVHISLDSSVFCPLWKRTKKDFWLWTGNLKKIHELWQNKNFSRRGNTDVETLRSVIEDSENLVWALVIPAVTTEGTMSKWKAWQWILVESGVIGPSADIPMINFSCFVRLIF